MQVQRTTQEGQPWQTRFEVRVDLGAGLTQRERVILFNSARRCEVNKLLSGDMTFDYALQEPSG